MFFSCSLQTGSNGNCFYVETPDTRLIIDAGISGKLAQQRLADKKRDIWQADAILVTHDHIDHSGNAGVFQRKIRKPLYMTLGTWGVCQRRLGVLYDSRQFACGDSLRFKATTVESIPTPHDGVDSVAYIISYEGRRLGIFTDLGHSFDALGGLIETLDGIYLESNYDPNMLANGPYPIGLQQRISGDGGHLSNDQAATLLRDHGQRLQWAVLSHLSEKNNRPELALSTAREIAGEKLNIMVAPRHDSFKMLVVE